VRLLHQLCLFPQVFTPPPQLQQLLGRDFGGPCTELIEAAQTLLQEVGLQVTMPDVATILRFLNNAEHCPTQQPLVPHMLDNAAEHAIPCRHAMRANQRYHAQPL
jgi:hypothetical protein